MRTAFSLGFGLCAFMLAGYAAPAFAKHHEDNEKNETATCASAHGQARAEEAKASQKPKKDKGKHKGEKGGTEDINIGLGELNEGCAESGAMGDIKRSENSDNENNSGEKGGTEDINIGVGELQECMKSMRGDEDANRKACMDRLGEAAKNHGEGKRRDDSDEDEE